jgi:hypothetical protein
MGISVFPAASAASKTMYRRTLTSGTSYTVPTGVNYINVTLIGGGGGAGCFSESAGNNPGAGGTTSFTGATSASGGSAGSSTTTGSNNTITVGVPGTNGTSGSGSAGSMGRYLGSANSTAVARQVIFTNHSPASGQIITSTLNTTPGSTINYSIGAGGNAGNAFGYDSGTGTGGSGGSGRIEIEYWV